jgi:hypothetical protein
MSVGCFTDKKYQPSEMEVAAALGDCLKLYQSLASWLRESYPVEEDFHFMYGKKYGWALRFRIKKQFLTNLYPAEGHFKVQANLPPEAVEMALILNLGENARRAIEGAHPYPEGRWVFAAVQSAADLADAQRLIQLRAEAKRLG